MSLNVIGLISGGKDSLYSLVHCIQNGHKLVALANLCPALLNDESSMEETDDLDSFMYQTVGHSLIPLYAQALDLPLYRRNITGKAVRTAKDYSLSTDDSPMEEREVTAQHDETEDMYSLLAEVLSNHPGANAVNAGAIMSTYQRTRVESVANRLNLTPLAFLWQYPILPPSEERYDTLTGLLDDMQSAMCDARIIKIASGGIRRNMIFQNVASSSSASRLVDGLSRFYESQHEELTLRGAVIGEGGEYETLALDGPSSLWKKKIQVDLADIREGGGGTMYARFGRAIVIDKPLEPSRVAPVPSIFDARFSALRSELAVVKNESFCRTSRSSHARSNTVTLAEPSMSVYTNTIHIPNLTAEGSTAADQLRGIVQQLSHMLTPSTDASASTTRVPGIFRNIINTTLLLNRMEDFASVNRVYTNKLWSSDWPIPPARVTVAAPLPSEVHVTLSVVLRRPQHDSLTSIDTTDGLHVQSRSYWAPANIGPYSQAVSLMLALPIDTDLVKDKPYVSTNLKLMHLAGQIPLIPATMEILTGSFADQATLSLQHLYRVAQERLVDIWIGPGVAYLGNKVTNHTTTDGKSVSDIDVMHSRACTAACAWHLSLEIDEKGHKRRQSLASNDEQDEEDADIWHAQHNHGQSARPQLNVGQHLHILPNHRILSVQGERIWRGTSSGSTETAKAHFPTFIAAEVLELPRNASVEWWSLGLAGVAKEVDLGRCEISPFRMVLNKYCLVEGLAIRHIDHARLARDGEDSTDDSEDESTTYQEQSRKTDRFTCFVSLLIDTTDSMSDMARIPEQVVSELSQSLSNGAELLNESISASQSFITVANDLSSLHDLSIVQQSTIIPCLQLWTSSQLDPVGVTGTSVRAIAAAVLLRVDLRLGKH